MLKSSQENAQPRVARVYDIANCGPRHRFVANGKLVSNCNLQNLKRGGELRRSILAPKGHVIVVSDSAQIEARVLAWLAGQDDVVEAFANKEDVYKLMASAIYGVPVDQVTKDQRFIGKIAQLGLGFSMGPQKLQQTLKQGVMGPPVDISLEECRRIVNIYRSRNFKIRQLWKIMDGIIASMLTGTSGKFGQLTYGKGYIQLPNGLFLQYYGLHGEAEVRHDDLVVQEATYLTRQGRSKIYGGLLTENCLAGDSLVLTNSGWKRLDCVGIGDLVHDGVEFVQHGGVLTKPVQNCVNIDGVYMTPDHEVLTDEGWKTASQNPEPYRPDLRQLGGHLASIQQWKKPFLGVQTEARPVFDIANAGPRQRFVVLGDNGPFVVHNCVQALARCIVAEQMLEISKKYRVVTMSHDEIVAVSPNKDADRCLRDMIRIMSTAPEWAKGLPLAAEGGYATNYSK